MRCVHLNRAVRIRFRRRGLRPRGFYNEAEGRIEMHLEAVRDQVVHDRRPGARVPRGRAHPHREFLQVRPGGIRGDTRERRIRLRSRRWDAKDVAYSVFHAA